MMTMGFSLDAWNVETVTLTDAEGNKARVLHRPVTTGWKARRNALLLQLMGDAPKQPEDGAEQAEWVEWWNAAAKSSKSAARDWEEFARDMLGDLLVGTRDMHDADGNDISAADLIAYLGKAGPKEAPAAPLVALAGSVMASGLVTEEGND
jgi:hypothetical protein